MTSRLARRIVAFAVAASLLPALRSAARESWPVPDAEVQARLDSYDKHERELLQKLKPEIEQWAKKGKPFIPWAAEPGDLPQAKIPAFPGAEGGGMYSFGGRGGKVYVVTSLDDAGPGTLREACEAAGPRIVVFNVAGIIRLKMPIYIEAPYITIAGQTAPGDGVCIADQGLIDNAHDVVIRHLRLRKGVSDIYNRHGVHYGNPVGNIVLDHVSASWGNDQNLDTYRHMYQPPEGGPALKLPSVNVTIQWCITSEALNTWNHSFGGDWGGRNTGFHHNLFACNTGRNPSIAMSYDFNFVNNVLFNWRHRSVDGGDENSEVNLINNYFKPGPATPDGPVRYRIIQPAQSWSKANPVSRWGKVYATGNVIEGNDAVSADNWDGGVQFNLAPGQLPQGSVGKGVHDPAMLRAIIEKVRVDRPMSMPRMTVQQAGEAYESVLAHAGATLPRRDAVDLRVIDAVRTGKTWGMGQETPIEPMKGLAKNNIGTAGNGIITDINQVGGYPEYKGEPVKYTQNDGIPDWWKAKYGLDVNDPDLARKDCNGDGYTNIEKYLNGIDPARRVDFADPDNNVDTLTPEKLRAPSHGTGSAAASGRGNDDAARKAVAQKAAKLVDALGLDDGEKAARVKTIVGDWLVVIRAWHAEHDAELAQLWGVWNKARAVVPKDEFPGEVIAHKIDATYASLEPPYTAFVRQLAAELTPAQVDALKERWSRSPGMTRTYNAYLQIVPDLSEPDKQVIRDRLLIAREAAMLTDSDKEIVAIYKRHKVKVEQYVGQLEWAKLHKAFAERERRQPETNAGKGTVGGVPAKTSAPASD